MCYTHKPGLEPRFVSGDDGTTSQISSQSVLPPLLSALRNPSRVCPLRNVKPIKKAESIDWKFSMNIGECQTLNPCSK
jgi:hypothetical protein